MNKNRFSNLYLKLAVWFILWTNVTYSVSGKCSCYSYNARQNSLENGRALCKGRNGDLVSLETVDEWEFIKDEIQSKTTEKEWWIGLHYDNKKKQWKWFSNCTLKYNDKWQPDKPNEVETKSNAIIVQEFPENQRGSFNNVRESSLKRGFICEYSYSESKLAVCSNNKRWCSPTTTKHLPTSRPSLDFITLSLHSSSITSTEKPLYITDPTSHFSKQEEFPVYAIIIILLIVAVIALLSTVFVYRFKKKGDLKPRNSHLSKDSRVPVRLEHNSSTNNLNDKIIYADVVNMDGIQIHVNNHSEADYRRAGNATEICKPSNDGNGSVYSNKNIEERTSNKETTKHSRYKPWNKSSDKEKLMSDFEEERNEAGFATCLYANVDCENNQKTTLVYAEIGGFKESGLTTPSCTMPEPYSETDYAVIVSPSNK